MFETTTVDEAIKRGKRSVVYPSLFIIVIGSMAPITLVPYLVAQPIITLGICVLLTFLLGWLYWSFAVVKWKLWAFENVRNVHELKQRAVLEQVIWADKSFFNKTEIWTRSQKEQWQSLQNKFEKPDLFTDDYTIPPETIIRYSRGKKLFFVVLMSGIFLAGLYWIISDKAYFGAWAVCAFGLVFAALSFRQYINRKPQLIISNTGIEIKGVQYNWSSIKEEEIKRKQEGKHVAYYLMFKHPEGVVKSSIGDLDAGYNKLWKL